MSQKLLLCSGAPLDMCDDRKLGEILCNWQGTKIICGGTTAKIIARELNRTVTVDLESARNSTLPPRSIIEGVDIVSEGIITLGRVRNLLQSIADQGHTFFDTSEQVDSQIAMMLLQHSEILFLVGTRYNKAHFSPYVPVKLERRVDLLKDIARILRDEFKKDITERYF